MKQRRRSGAPGPVCDGSLDWPSSAVALGGAKTPERTIQAERAIKKERTIARERANCVERTKGHERGRKEEGHGMTLGEVNELLVADGIEPVDTGAILRWEGSGWLPAVPRHSGWRDFNRAAVQRVRALASSPLRHRRGRPPKGERRP